MRCLAAEPSESNPADDDWKQFESLLHHLGPMTGGYRNLAVAPEFEREKFFEARARRVGEFAMNFYTKHPEDPRRWSVVESFVFSQSPRFVKDWGPVDAAGKLHPVIDEPAAQAWKAAVADLRAAFDKATDIPESVRKSHAERERREASQRLFRDRWQSGRHERAPEITVLAADGRTVKLSDFKGKTVVLDFWATWCGPCQDAIPFNQQVAARYKDQNVVVLGVCVWDQKEKFDSWMKQNQAHYPDIAWAFDPSGRGETALARKLYDVPAIPAVFIIDGEGTVVDALLGFSESEGSRPLEGALAKAGVHMTAPPESVPTLRK
ncbi:MAG: TlpA family protein disulfide reductase [Candidatus Didemnitutus sp.]|nr:TlpA family protein disulfide reductase [Candidatus Didemnitutus sp.]